MKLLNEPDVPPITVTTPPLTKRTPALTPQPAYNLRRRDLGDQIAAFDERWPAKKYRK